MNNLEQKTLESYGFVSGQIGFPFHLVDVDYVSRQETAHELVSIIDDLEARLGQKSGLLGGIKRGGAGVISNLFSKRILGLYCPSYLNNRPDRLILVEENLLNVSDQLGFDYDIFLTWVLTHEMTHVAQFNSFKKELPDTIFSKIESVFSKKGDVSSLKAAMTWAEGSADFIMDRPGLVSKSDIDSMRRLVNLKRSSFSWMNLIIRLLGNKTGQYVNGYRFSEEVSKKLGPSSVALPIQYPNLLPSPEEINNPDLWVARACP